MIIPIGTDRPRRRHPTVTFGLILLNVAAFVAMVATSAAAHLPLEDGTEGVLQRFDWAGWNPGQWWRLLTYAFLHSPTDWFHIAGNMLFLWVFGPSVEDRLGHIGFTVLYLVGAAVSALSHSFFSQAHLIGASGAIAAVTGAFMVFFPRVQVRVLVFFMVVGVFRFPALGFVCFALARDFLMMGSSSGVSNAAHLGGYAVGITASILLLATRVLKREPQYDLLSVFQHRSRLRDFRAAAEINDERERRLRAIREPRKPQTTSLDAEIVALARAEVSMHLNKGESEAACEAYRHMLAKFPSGGTGLILSRQNQLNLANFLFQSSDHASALVAYRHYLVAYPKDVQAAHVHLMIGLIRVRYIPESVEARKEIEAALPVLEDEDDRTLARSLLDELGPLPATGAQPVEGQR